MSSLPAHLDPVASPTADHAAMRIKSTLLTRCLPRSAALSARVRQLRRWTCRPGRGITYATPSPRSMLLLMAPVIVPSLLGLPVAPLCLPTPRLPSRIAARLRTVPMPAVTTTADREWSLAPSARAQMHPGIRPSCADSISSSAYSTSPSGCASLLPRSVSSSAHPDLLPESLGSTRGFLFLPAGFPQPISPTQRAHARDDVARPHGPFFSGFP